MLAADRHQYAAARAIQTRDRVGCCRIDAIALGQSPLTLTIETHAFSEPVGTTRDDHQTGYAGPFAFCARSPEPALCSRMNTATTTPDMNVSAAIAMIAAASPNWSAMMPADSAPIA